MTAATMAIFLRAVAAVESGGDERAVGSAGERGQFQLSPAVAATAGGYSVRAAEREVRRIEAGLLHMGAEAVPFNIYLAYNAGLGAVRRGQAPVASYQRAVRFCAVLERLEREKAWQQKTQGAQK